MNRPWLGLLFLVIAASAAAPAAAQNAAPNAAQQRLFFGTLALGIGDCNDVLCGPAEANTGPFFGVGAGIYIRPLPWLAAGFDLHLNAILADDIDRDRADEGASYALANIAVRGIVPLNAPVEPWAGLGFGYANFSYDWHKPKDDKSEDLSVTGSNLALAFGADVSVADRFWIGGALRFAFPFWTERCKEKIEPGKTDLECRDVDTLDVEDQEELPTMLWFAGVTGRVDF